MVTITPFQQVWNATSNREHQLIKPILDPLDLQHQEDICLALVAWLRFGIRREFWDPELNDVFIQLIDLIIKERGLSIFYNK